MIQQGQVFKLKTKGPVPRRRWNSGQRVRSKCFLGVVACIGGQ
jgi:hypothetical protein